MTQDELDDYRRKADAFWNDYKRGRIKGVIVPAGSISHHLTSKEAERRKSRRKWTTYKTIAEINAMLATTNS